MTVYVDHARHRLGRMVMSHMMADTDEELHAMAERIGVARRWFQGDHYDVCAKMRRRAIVAGALEVTARALVGLRRIREGRGTERDRKEAWACRPC